VLGGVLVDMGSFDWTAYQNISEHYKVADTAQWGLTQVKKRGLRDMGATLAPEAAAQVAIGLETMTMRLHKTCENALALAQFLSALPQVKTVHYPGLQEHPQHKRATELFKSGMYGGILSFTLADKIEPRTFLNDLELVISATHLGDTRTLALPVATTIFYENGLEERIKMGIDESLIRLSVGIENIEDLQTDFSQAFKKQSL
jgi:O-acetylhomoserine (thiol)-lyase